MADRERGPWELALHEQNEFLNANLPRFFAGEDLPIHPLWAPDIEFINFEPSPFPGTYKGHDGLQKWTQDMFGDFSEARVDVLEAREEGDLMAARMKLTARGRASGIEGSFEWGTLMTMRDGQCIQAASDVSYERSLERFRERLEQSGS